MDSLTELDGPWSAGWTFLAKLITSDLNNVPVCFENGLYVAVATSLTDTLLCAGYSVNVPMRGIRHMMVASKACDSPISGQPFHRRCVELVPSCRLSL